MITALSHIFKEQTTKPQLKNMILVAIAMAMSKIFRINELSRHLPVAVSSEKTRQKRLLRFVDSNLPTESICDRWLKFVIETVYRSGQTNALILIDETDLIGDYKAMVAAIAFRRRAILIDFLIYRDSDIQSMKYKSHNEIIELFSKRVHHKAAKALPKQKRPILVFDRGFDRARWVIKPLIDNGIWFLIRACENTGLMTEGQKTTLRKLPACGAYRNILYQHTEKIRLNLYVVHDESFDDPMYVISNCYQGLDIYLGYRRRMQIEQGFRDMKTTFGFKALTFKKLEQSRLEILWLMLCITYGLLMLQYEKSGYRWSVQFNGTQKDKSLIWVIKAVISRGWLGFELDWNFSLPLFSADVAQLGHSGCFSLL